MELFCFYGTYCDRNRGIVLSGLSIPLKLVPLLEIATQCQFRANALSAWTYRCRSHYQTTSGSQPLFPRARPKNNPFSSWNSSSSASLFIQHSPIEKYPVMVGERACQGKGFRSGTITLVKRTRASFWLSGSLSSS